MPDPTLKNVFEAILKFFHNNVGVSWGWSIVLLTVVVRAVLLPLTVKQFHSMQKMQRLNRSLRRRPNSPQGRRTRLLQSLKSAMR